MTDDTGTQERPATANGALRALAIVAEELLETIASAQLAIEDCVDGRGGAPALIRAAELLHQVHGALRVTETYGAALLAEEMELACRYLASLRVGKGRDDGLDALTRSMVQLPIYLERLLGGGRDIALILLPILNDLRAARGEPLLSEGTLLLLDLSPSRNPDRGNRPGGSGDDPVRVAARLRPTLQLALLGWIKGGDVKPHLDTLSRVAAALEKAATRDDMYQLWRIVGGVVEALADGGLETSVALKRLLGQTDRQVKWTIDQGAAAFDRHPVDDLVNNLLYYVARSTSTGPRISDIRAAFNLSDLLPGDAQVAHAREALAAPSARLMQTVAAAIKEDLGTVKDVLDIFVRTGMNKPADLVPQLELLQKIGDTLGVLGLGELRSDVDGEIRRLRDVVENGASQSESLILDIASTLLRVEDRLDRQLVRLTVPEEVVVPAPDVEAAEFRQVAESVMRECIVNLARIKETVSQSLNSRAPAPGLDAMPSLVRGIKAGLLMLNKTRAMEVVDRVGQLIAAVLHSGGLSCLTQKEADRLADAIVSIEYYMETVKAGRSEPAYMLDNAEACLSVLRDVEARLCRAGEDAAAPPADLAPSAEAASRAGDARQSPGVMPPPVVAADAEHLDPELLELFIDEAREAVASMQCHLPVWLDSPEDMEALIAVRRSFHTLKGSGRMVGAERIGEYCWAVENLLNRLINRTLKPTPSMREFIAAAALAVPDLIEQLEVGTEPVVDIALLRARAHAFADGDPEAPALTVEPSDQPAAEPALEMDPVLLDIFAKETAGHLKVITDYVGACAGHVPPFAVTDKLYRACHTLHGSANMANVDRGIQVAGALNRYVRRVHDHGAGFDAAGLDALRTGASAIARIVADINEPGVERADYADFVAGLAALADAVQPRDTLTGVGIEPVATLDEPPPAAAGPEYDAEIAAIFTEESAELLEATDKAFGEWSADDSRRSALEELKRHLHTLKGGARMAGIAAMGNLSHELETLLGAVEDRRVEPNPAIHGVLRQAIDELHRMRDRVMAGKAVPANGPLEQRLRNATGGFGAAPGQIVGEPDASGVDPHRHDATLVEFSIEPEDAVSMVIVDSPLADELRDISPTSAANAEVLSAEAAIPHAAPRSEAQPRPESGSEPAVPAERSDDEAPGRTPPAGETPSPTDRTRSARHAEARPEFARVDAELLEGLLNAAGEISIYHSRLDQQLNSIEFHVEEFEQTVQRARGQLRKLEIETEAQIMAGHQNTTVARDFDPLELDRYSNLQQLSRALAESANDLDSLKDLLASLTAEAESLLVQQSRVIAELQDGLMRTRMVPFERHVPRLTRLVRQAANEAGKRAELAVEGASGELDRQVLDKMLPAFEHMLRNAVVHGIETPDSRQSAGKLPSGRITIRLYREGTEMVIDVADDGQGLDVERIRAKAYEFDLLSPDAKVTDAEVMDLIVKPGFSTAAQVTQSAGRGVGMDVVANEVKKLGGSLRIASVTGQGTNFTLRLPFTLAITQALIVRTGDEVYALPLPSVEGVTRIARRELENLLAQSEPSYQYGEQSYQFRHLGMYLGGQAAQLSADDAFISVILVRAGDCSAALLVDEMLTSREIVVKGVGPQLAGIRGISGATILGDGRIVLILDINALVRTGAPVVDIKRAAPAAADKRPLALVVDDSITVRRVTERCLKRNGMRVVTAKDGLDAISVLGDYRPDVILLDIEMPRMDGYEFASHVRNDERVADVPIIMITSRVGDKHRARAIELGVNDYLGKPYQDSQLLEAIRRQFEDRGIALS